MTSTAMKHSFAIVGYVPPRLNELLGSWQKAARLKRECCEFVGFYAKQAGVSLARGKRRVSLRITLPKGRRAPDPDSLWKATLDALVCCGLLVNDSGPCVELGTVEFARGDELETRVELEDIEE